MTQQEFLNKFYDGVKQVVNLLHGLSMDTRQYTDRLEKTCARNEEFFVLKQENKLLTEQLSYAIKKASELERAQKTREKAKERAFNNFGAYKANENDPPQKRIDTKGTAKNVDKHKVGMDKHRETHRKQLENNREYAERCKKYKRQYDLEYKEQRKARMESDPEYAEAVRAKRREYRAKHDAKYADNPEYLEKARQRTNEAVKRYQAKKKE